MTIEIYPNLVDRLILTNPAITFGRQQALAFLERTAGPMKKRLPMLEHLETEQEELPPEQLFQNDSFLNFIFSKHNPSNSLKHIAAMSSWFYQYDATSFFQQVHIPTLVLLGKEDEICDNEETQRIIEIQSSPYLHCISYSPCGHALFEDQAEAFVEAISQFL